MPDDTHKMFIVFNVCLLIAFLILGIRACQEMNKQAEVEVQKTNQIELEGNIEIKGDNYIFKCKKVTIHQ